MVNLKINGTSVEVPNGTSILNAAKKAYINIPSLCYHPDLSPSAGCGICIVKVKGMSKIIRACATEVTEGMDVITTDAELYETRKTVIELILSNHPDDCLRCQRNQNCELQRLAAEYGIRENPISKKLREIPKDESTTSLILEPQKCVLCGRCVEVCQNRQKVYALEFIGRGYDMRIAPAGDIKMEDSPCIKCGQCSAHCPVGAIVERDEVEIVFQGLRNEELYPVVQMAPAVRVAFGEGFGLRSGEIVTGKLYSLFRKLGFKGVFDTNFAADLTIMEEGSEFVDKFLNAPDTLPLITSCCPGWVDYLEKYYHDMIRYFSTAKSPHEMLGVLSKTYYAKKMGVDPSKIFMVSIMPCTAKKWEIGRSNEMFSSGYKDIDVVLTTRELVRLTKSAGIDFINLPEESPDSILGEYTGAGTIFGVTGGVMEAALRTAYNLVTGENLGKVDFESVRGFKGVKEAEVDIKGTKISVAVAHGIGNVKQVLDVIRKNKKEGKKSPWHFIEVMACEGGCIAGGGQPYGITQKIREMRTDGIYKDDKNQKIRCSHDNPEIKGLYKNFLEKPNSHKAHKLLHTKYTPRQVYLR